MKTKKKRTRKLLTGVLLLIECIAVIDCFAIINVYSQEHQIDRAFNSSAAMIMTSAAAPTLAAKSSVDVHNELTRWKGPVLSKGRGTITGPSGKETYYNLNMTGVVNIMRRMGNEDEYWVRDDGCKMLGDYIMVAANLNVHPRGSLVDTSLGKAIVCDTGGFAVRNPNQLDIAVTW